MQYFRFAFTAIAIFGIANSSPLLYEAATAEQAKGLEPIPAKFGSDYNNPHTINRLASSDVYNANKVTKPAAGKSYDNSVTKPAAGNSYHNSVTKPAAGNSYHNAVARPAAGNSYDNTVTRPAAGNSYNNNNKDELDTAYSIYRSSLQSLANALQGRSSTQRASNPDTSRAAYRSAVSTFGAFREAARPKRTVCAALRLIPAEDQETAVRYVAFVQHTAIDAYQHAQQGDGQSAYWSFCLIDDYMAAVSSYIERGQDVYNGKSIGTY